MKRRVMPGLLIGATKRGINQIKLARQRPSRLSRADGGALARRWKEAAGRELRSYFGARLRSFSVRCDLTNLPPFTRDVLRVAAQIPYGEVRSYRWVAQRVGKPNAARAVGNALAKNPVPLIIPCHRVVRTDGSLGGYSFGRGWKKKLLELERRHHSQS